MDYSFRATHGLTPNPRNARTHPEAQIEKIKKSIKAYGFLNPIIVDKAGMVIAGHARLEAAKALGIAEVPCILADHLTPAQVRGYMLADNRIAADGGYDEEILAEELRGLFAEDFDLDLTGFDTDELSRFLSDPAELTDEDDVPEPPAVPITRLGDLWLCGLHRVRCGDSCDPEGVKALLGACVPHLMVTDPPYGVEYDANWRNKAARNSAGMGNRNLGAGAIGNVLNDDRADWSEAWELFPGDVAYVWHAGKFSGIVQQSLESTGFGAVSQIIWSKGHIAIGRGDYHWKHEPCWYAVRAGKNHHWQGSRKESSVWDIDKPQKSETGHSTQKPVECMRRPIVNNSKAGEAVYDPFLGSGTTLIAAETEARVCYGQELNPAYVDIIVRRWQEFTGRQAVRESDGIPFDDLSPAQEAA